jgi:hypothetical protein
MNFRAFFRSFGTGQEEGLAPAVGMSGGQAALSDLFYSINPNSIFAVQRFGNETDQAVLLMISHNPDRAQAHFFRPPRIVCTSSPSFSHKKAQEAHY